MKILLVDNGSKLIRELAAALPGELVTVPWSGVGSTDTTDFDLIVLSGGSGFSVSGNEEKLKDEIRLIRDDRKPLIGVCFGCELIADAFGGVLERMPADHQGEVRITVEPTHREFFGFDEFTSYEHHIWRIKQVPPEFIVMASSEHGPELIRHRKLPIFGLQFHPEKVIDGATGMNILQRIFDHVYQGIEAAKKPA